MIIAQNWTIARAQREDVKQAFFNHGFEVEDLLVVVGLNAFDVTIDEDLVSFRIGGPEKHELGFGTLNTLHSHAPVDEPGLLRVCEILGKFVVEPGYIITCDLKQDLEGYFFDKDGVYQATNITVQATRGAQIKDEEEDAQ